MKKILALIVFAIGLMVALPTESSGSKAPPGQVSFITDYSVAPAIAVAQEIAFVNQFNQLAQAPEFIEGQEEGGYTVEKSLNTLLDAGNKNKDVVISKVPIYKLNCNFGFLLCLYDQVIINSKTSLKNIKSAGPVTIRKLTQV